MFCVLLSLQFLVLLQIASAWSVNFKKLYTNRCLTPDLTPGLCILIEDCYSMTQFLHPFANGELPKEVKTFVQEHVCGYELGRPRVCCPSTPLLFDYQHLRVEKLPDVSYHPNLMLLPPICGTTPWATKITYGDRARISEFPWMALIAYTTYQGPQFQCGGSILNQNYILTAAHCLTRLKFPLLSVRVGDHDWRSEQDCETTQLGVFCAPPPQELQIIKAIPHEKYNHVTSQNDIGLIRVTPMNLGPENVGPICMPLGEARNFFFDNAVGTVAGWGITEKGVPSTVLLKVTLPFIPLDVCQIKYGNSASLDYRQICAGGTSRMDSCGGDSGGPLFVNTTVKGHYKYVQLGLVSFGPTKCGQVPVPGVYTKVAAFMDWILDHLEP